MTNDEWLKDQCNRYKNGHCGTLACLNRGGYDRNKEVAPDYTKATCHAHEVLEELKSLREDSDNLNREQGLIK